MAATHKQYSSHFFLRFCVLTIFRNARLLVFFSSKHWLLLSFKHFGSQPPHLRGGWGHKQQVYGLPHATYIAMFIEIFAKLKYGRPGYTFAHMTTRARNFKSAGAIVQRLYLVMVALTQTFFSTLYMVFLWTYVIG